MEKYQPSEYQTSCAEFYRLLRDVHVDAHLSPERIRKELYDKRYSDESHPVIQNLNSFFSLLHGLCGDGPGVSGIDYGCGSHWFVHHVRRTFGWSVVGYDSDPQAIEVARARFPEDAESYQVRDLQGDGLPEAAASQHFVMSNAVLQHFDDRELKATIAEMARVLRPAGCCLLIFKRWTAEIADSTDRISPDIQVLDAASGKVLYRDPTMRKAIATLGGPELENLSAEQREGWRLLHLVPVEQVLEMGSTHALTPAKLMSADGTPLPSTLTYRSGKGMPTAAVYLTKG